MFTPALALLISVVALFLDKSKTFGILGLAISGLTCLFLLSLILIALTV